MNADKILKLIAELPDKQRTELLEELNTTYGTGNIINDFCKWHQEAFNKNIAFEVKKEGAANQLIIEVKLITRFGEFVAVGKNQKIAKVRAISKAKKNFNK